MRSSRLGNLGLKGKGEGAAMSHSEPNAARLTADLESELARVLVRWTVQILRAARASRTRA